MTTNTLSSYLLAVILILSVIFTVSWGVQRLLSKSIEAQKVSTESSKRVKFSL